jgi:hypothetical protein
LEALLAGFDMFLTLKFLSISEVFSPLWFLSDYQPFFRKFFLIGNFRNFLRHYGLYSIKKDLQKYGIKKIEEIKESEKTKVSQRCRTRYPLNPLLGVSYLLVVHFPDRDLQTYCGIRGISKGRRNR